jgi:hypothetical protein
MNWLWVYAYVVMPIAVVALGYAAVRWDMPLSAGMSVSAMTLPTSTMVRRSDQSDAADLRT